MKIFIRYFSKLKWKLVEIKSISSAVFLENKVPLVFIPVLFLVFYFFNDSIKGHDSRISSARIYELTSLYNELNNIIDSLATANNELRAAANLPPVNRQKSVIRTGGIIIDQKLDLTGKYPDIDLDEINQYIKILHGKIAFEKAAYAELSERLKYSAKLYAAIPSLKPADGIIAEEGFGMRVHPILKTSIMHDGIDILTDVGSPVVSPGNGIVTFIGSRGGYGLCVEVDHGFGYVTVFGHLSGSMVKIGQKVNRGQKIALTGNSGLSSGPHLHYEVWHDGIKMDPMDFIFDDNKVYNLTANKK